MASDTEATLPVEGSGPDGSRKDAEDAVEPAIIVGLDAATAEDLDTEAKAAWSVSPAEVELYGRLKGELQSVLKREGGGTVFFGSLGPDGRVGLLNQGATCYMNSLLQSLFYTPGFLPRLFSWSFSPSKDGDPEFCIPLQLQRLFARMRGGLRPAVSTRELTTSFRWSADKSFQQHDVQEFCSALFGALETALDSSKLVEQLFQGQVVDVLKCTVCGYERRQADKFIDLELPIAGVPHVAQALRQYCSEELLTGDNQWFCPKCDAKVDAVKALHITHVPNILTLHLQRFSFDFATMRRVKLNDTFKLCNSLDSRDFVAPDETGQVQSVKYQPFAVMIHQGTALGGHYFAYVNPPATDAWMEFNDVAIRPLDPAHVRGSWLETASAAGAITALEESKAIDETVQPAGSTPVQLNMWNNAYLVMYRRCDDTELAGRDAELTAPLQAMLNTENQQYLQLRTAFRVKQALLEMCIYAENGNRVLLDVPLSCTLHYATDQAYTHLYKDASAGVPARHNVRLRSYVPGCKRPTETYSGQESAALGTLGFKHSATMILETREEGHDWIPYNPNAMIVRVIQWNPESPNDILETTVSAGVPVTVPGDLAATVLLLRQALELHPAFGVPCTKQRLISVGDSRATVLTGADAQLRRDFNLHPYDIVVLEAVEHEAEAESSLSSAALSHYELSMNVITVCFNHPDAPDSIDRHVQSNRNHTLQQLKAMIAKELDMDVETFNLRRNATAPQLKQPDATLKSLDIVDQSMVFVARGAPLAADQVLLRVFLYSPREDPAFKLLLDELPVSESQTIGSLKRQLSKHERVNTAPSHIRLRQKTGTTEGKIFRDAATIRASYTNLNDGTEVAVQVLDFAEHTTVQEMVLGIRWWRPLRRKIIRDDLVIRKKATVAQLLERLHTMFGIGAAPAGCDAAPVASCADAPEDEKLSEPELEAVRAVAHVPCGIGIVKMPKFPVLSLKTVGTLAWNDPPLEMDAELHACGLRDGVVIVVRDERDCAVHAVRKASADSAAASTAAGAAKPGSLRGRIGAKAGSHPSRSTYVPREYSVKIAVTRDGDAGGPEWPCPACTFLNPSSASACTMCGTSR